MKKNLFLLILLIFSFKVYSQRDTEFWFAFPDLILGSTNHTDEKIALYLVTFDMPATVTIAQPANSAFTPIVYRMSPNSFQPVTMGNLKSMLETVDRLILPYGIQITADNEVAVYYANYGDNCEVYTLKGKNALGTDFIVPMQYEYESSTVYPGRSSIEIVATEDNTVVNIDTRVPTTELNTAGTITKTLNRGECYAIKAAGITAADHLHNTRVRSNKPVAVNSTDDSAAGPGVDLIGEQIVPVELVGTDYIAIKNDGDNEKVYIFATQNNTNVTIEGISIPPISLNTPHVYKLRNETTHITSDKPVIVFQITSVGTEMGGTMLPQINCTGSMEVVFQSVFGNYTVLNIITKTSNISGFTVNGQANVIQASMFQPVPGTSGVWSYCRVPFSNNKQVLRIKNSIGFFHMGAYDTMDRSCTYGYFSDYHSVGLRTKLSQEYYASGETLHLSLWDADAFTNVVWTKHPEGIKYYGNELIINNIDASYSGIYSVSAEHIEGCPISSDGYAVVNILEPQKTELKSCKGDSLYLTAEGLGPYKWLPGQNHPDTATLGIFPNADVIYTVNNYKKGINNLLNGDFQTGNSGFSSSYQYSSTSVATSGSYSVASNANAVNPAFGRVYDHTSGLATFGRHMIVKCKGDAGDKIWADTIAVKAHTKYEIAAWFITAKQGDTPAQLQFTINDSPVGGTIIPPNSEEGNRQRHWQQFSYIWDSGDFTKAAISIETALGIADGAGVCIDDITFSAYLAITDTFEIKLDSIPQPIISGDSVICQGSAVLDAGTMDNGVPYSSYSWYNSNGVPIGKNRTVAVNSPGKYTVEVAYQNCKETAFFIVGIGEEISVTIDSIAEVCSGDSDFIIHHDLAGNVDSYSILYDRDAKAAGFTDILNQTVNGEWTIPLPMNVYPGIYNAQVQVTGGSATDCGVSNFVPIKIKVKYKAEDVMAQKWNDVIALLNAKYNGGFNFTAYQWYKNGEPIPGETSPYLYLRNEILSSDDAYSVLLTRDDGVILFTCDFIPTYRVIQNSVPTLVNTSQIIPLSVVSSKGSATFWDINGLLHSTQMVDSENKQIQAPAQKGMYILNLVFDDDCSQYKMVVK